MLGYNGYPKNSNELRQICADLYYQKGTELWGDDYDIVLGGGYFSVRAPGFLETGNITYAQLQMLMPFDNYLVLCSIKGRDLKEKFIETKNSDYFISNGSSGDLMKQEIDPNGTYYIVVDTYTSTWKPNNLTEIIRYSEEYFARDMLAEYISSGKMQ